MSNKLSPDIRLPLDLLIILDVDVLEEALSCQYAVEHESEISFCKNKDDLKEFLEDYEDAIYYEIDDIELDRIRAIIELLNAAEENSLLSHILDRIVR